MTELLNVIHVEDPCGPSYFLGTLTASQIKELLFVPVVTLSTIRDTESSLNEKVEGGYQRAGDVGRMKKIKEFYKTNDSMVIPPVLLAGRGAWKFVPSSGTNKRFGKLVGDDLAAIIDGQHRLGGLWALVKDAEVSDAAKARPIPFLMIENLPLDDEKYNFININDTQQGVKKSLLKYLKREENFNAQVALALMEDDDSVFKGRISLQKKEDWSLFLFGAAEECVAETFDKSFVSATGFKPMENDEAKSKAIEIYLKYWKLVCANFPLQWADINYMPPPQSPKTAEQKGSRAFEYRLLEETGVRAFARIGSNILRSCWIASMNSPAFDCVETTLKKISKDPNVKLALTKAQGEIKAQIVSLDPDLTSTGKAGVKAIYSKLLDAMTKTT